MEPLHARSDLFCTEPGQKCSSSHSCAGSGNKVTVLSCNVVSDIIPINSARSDLSKRQRKRISERKRKRNMYNRVNNLATKVTEQEVFLADTKEKVDVLHVQKNLYKR